MLTTREVKGVRVRNTPKPGKELTKDGLPRRGRKIGKIYKTVFDPSGLRVVGFIVKRPDLLWMIKRADKFLALDSIEATDGVISPCKGLDSWDDRAIKRMDVNYDTCIIWEGMPVSTSDGEDLGHVDDISFDEDTGAVESLFLDDGGTARVLVGSVEIPRDLMVGYKDGQLLVKPEAAKCGLTGGLAARAGEATAKTVNVAKEGAHNAGKAVGKAVDKGSYGLGKAIGRVKGSITGAHDAYRAEVPKKKKVAKPAAKPAATTAAKPAAKPAATKSSASASTAATKPAAKSTAAAKPAAAKTTAARSAAKAASTSAAAKPAAKPAATKAAASSTKTSSTATSAKQTTTKAAPQKKTAGQAAGDHLKAASHMFADFKAEFDKSKRDDS